MLKEIGSYDAKTKLPEILRRVEAGEAFTITNRGRAVADLVPSRASRRLKTDKAIQNILKAKKPKVPDEMLGKFRENGRK